MDVLPRLFLWFSQVKHFDCRHIPPPQEVQCVHMYSVAWDALVICTNHYLTETGWRGEGLCGRTVFDSVLIVDSNNIATRVGMTFLCWGMCKVTRHFGCSSVADVHRYTV